MNRLDRELGHIEAGGDREHAAHPGKRGCDQLDGAAPSRDRHGERTDGRGDYRAREVPGAERVGGEQDHNRVGAGGRGPEHESLLQPDTVCREPHTDGSEPCEKP